MPQETKARKFPCRQCGARLDFDPGAQSLKCPFCGHAEAIAPPDQGVEERDYLDYLKDQKLETITGRSCEVRCPGCAAIVLIEDKVVTERCPFCTTHLENQPTEAAAMIPPESILPFKVSEKQARSAFNGWIGGLWFAPTELKQLANLGQLAGVYLPFWTYDSQTVSRYRGERGDNYQDTETYTERDSEGREVVKTRTVTRTLWTSVSGTVEHFFDDVLVCASKSVPRERIEQIQNWELPELTGFMPDYLSGFKTERYAVGLEEGFEQAKAIMDGRIAELCRRDIGGDHQRLHDVRSKYLGVTFKHLLLPVWLAAYRYRETLYRVYVNARSGHVVGDRPYSVGKIVAAVLLAVAIVAAIVGVVAVVQKRADAGPRRYAAAVTAAPPTSGRPTPPSPAPRRPRTATTTPTASSLAAAFASPSAA